MTNIDYEYYDFRPTGFVTVKLPQDLVEKLVKRCDELHVPINDRLAGNIRKEFSLELHKKSKMKFVINCGSNVQLLLKDIRKDILILKCANICLVTHHWILDMCGQTS